MDASQEIGRRKLLETNASIVGLFVCFVLAKLIQWLPKDFSGNGLHEWVYTDWLIDYSAGFVRRGFAGEIVRGLSHFARPKVVVALLAWGILGAFTAAYLRAVSRWLDRLHPILVAGLLFLPALLPFYLYDHGAVGRKETVGFLILAWHLFVLRSPGSGQAGAYFKRMVPVDWIALPIHVLMHEGSFLLFVPVHALLSLSVLRLDTSLGASRRWLTLAALYFPVSAAFLVVFLCGRPPFETALAICRHWEARGALPPGAFTYPGQDPTWALPGSITTLPWTVSQAAALTLSFTVQDVVDWVVIFSILGFFTAYLGSMVTDALVSDGSAGVFNRRVFGPGPCRRLLGRYFALPLLASIPLYVVGWDVGRWFAVSCINYTLIVLSKEVLQTELQHLGYSAAGPAQTFPAGDISPVSRRFYLNLAAFLTVVLFFRLPHCCIEGFNMLAEPVNYLFENFMHVLFR